MKKEHFEVLLEDINGKFQLVLEGHEVLHTGIRDLRRETGERFDLVDFKVDTLNKKVDSLDSRVGSLEQKVDALDSRVGSLEQKVDALDSRMGSLEQKADALDNRMGSLEQKVDAVAADLSAHRADTEAHRGVYRVME